MTEYKKWRLQDRDLANLSGSGARDLVIKCFFEAQKETFARAKQELGRAANDDEIQKSVETVVRLTFSDVGGSFENPSKKDLSKVVEVLASKAATWGTPKDIIEHHKGQIIRVLNSLKE